MKLFKSAALVFCILCFVFPAHHALASPARDQLQTTIDKLLEILKDPSLKGEEHTEQRRDALRKVIRERFSQTKMAQLTLGRHWRKRTREEKKQFAELFGKLLEKTYISKVEAYTDEKVVFVKEFVKKRKAQIYTKVVTDTVEIPIDYRMFRKKDGTWMVYDIVIEGVSLVGNYRSQFDQSLQKGSYEDLVRDLKTKVQS
jgi:phospholipid transport system substrate-binding protein